MVLADQLPAPELPDLQLQVVLVGALQPLVLGSLVLPDTLLVVPVVRQADGPMMRHEYSGPDQLISSAL